MHRAEYLTIDSRLAYVEIAGEGANPLLCVHTAGQSGVQYRYVIEGLAARGYTVIVVDLPGHGRSEPATNGLISDLGWYADWCLRVLRELDAGRPYLLGCSIGGRIVLDMATKASSSLAGVVAMEGPISPLSPSGPGPGLQRVPEDSGTPSVRDQTFFANVDLIGQSVRPELVRMIAEMHCREDWHVTRSDLQGWARHDIWEKLPGISCPTYLVFGADSAVDMATARENAQRILGARLEILEGIGHYPMLEMADFVDRCAGWLKLLASNVAAG